MKGCTLKPSPAHEAFRQDVIALLRKHGGNLSSIELLALAAHLTGQVWAMCDARTVSAEMAMETVSKNIALGNQEAIDNILRTEGSA